MSKVQVKVRYKHARARIRAGADRFFGDPPLENKGRMQNATGKTRDDYSDIGEGPEYDLEQEESYREARKDFENRREDGP